MLKPSLKAVALLAVALALPLRAEPPAPQTSAEIAQARRSSVELLPQISIVSANNFTLQTESYTIPLSESLQGIPTFSIGMRIPTGTLWGLETAVVPRTGYGYKAGIFSVNGSDGSSNKQNLRLHTLPASATFQALYEIPGVSGLKIGANLGMGAVYVFQNGNEDSLNQSYFLPCLFIGPAVSFMDYGDADDWFHGFTFGVTLQNSLGSKQVLRAFSIDLGVNIAF